MNKPKLFLHAGAPKTGSSALQTSFALSMDGLSQQGIFYPTPPKLQDAVAGMITSGNYNPARVKDLYHAALEKSADSRCILFSNEAGFRLLPEPDGQLLSLARSGIEIETLLFIRNPIELACSSYVQTVKRHGSSADPTQFFKKFGAIDRVEEFVAFFDAHGLKLNLFNYSKLGDRLFHVVEDLLDVNRDTLKSPPVAQVNRSLSRAEIRLVRDLNASIGKEAASLVADALCNELPDVRAEPPNVSKHAYAALVERVSPVIERLNARLPGSEVYEITPYEEAFGDQPENYDAGLKFSKDQQRVIRDALVTALEKPAEATRVPKVWSALLSRFH